MAGLNFIIGADNTDFLAKIEAIKAGVEQASKLIEKAGESIDMSTAEEKIAGLNEVIERNNQQILRISESLNQYQEEANSAFASGDMAGFNKATSDMEKQATELQSLIADTQEYRQALATLEGATGASASAEAGAVEAPKLFTSQEDYEYAEQLRAKIVELKTELSTCGSETDMQALRDQLTSAQEDLRACDDAAAQAAASLGTDLGGRAAEASTNLYQLNSAVEDQQQVVENLQASVEAAGEALEELKASNADTSDIETAQMQYDSLSNSLENATMALYNLQAAQEDATTSMEGINNEINLTNSSFVKAMGGMQSFNQMVSVLPQGLQSVVKGIAGMTTGAKAFSATGLGAILGAIALVLSTVYNWFTQTSEGQMLFAKISGSVTAILGKLKDMLFNVGKGVVDAGKKIVDAFTHPIDTLKKFAEALKENVINRIKGVGGMFSSVGKIIQHVFKGEWDEIGDEVKELGNQFLQASTGVENFSEKVVDAWDKTKEAVSGIADAAKEGWSFGEAQKQLERDISDWQVKNQELETEMAKARQIYMDRTASTEARQNAFEDYKRLLDEQVAKETEFAERALENQRTKMSFSENGDEDYAEENRLIAALEAVKTKREQQLAQLTRQANMINGSSYGQEEKTVEDALTKIGQLEQTIRSANQKETIALMKDGTAKKIAQIDADYEAQRDAITKNAQQLSQLNKDAGVEATFKIKVGDVEVEGLTEEQSGMLQNSLGLAEVARAEDIKTALNSELDGIRTYEEQRLAIEEEYEEKRKSLYEDDYSKDEKGKASGTLREGVQQGNIDELDYQEQELLAKLDEQFAQRELDYEVWCNKIADIGLEALQQTLDQAQAALEEAEASGVGGSQLAAARAKVNTAQKKVDKKAAEGDQGPNKRSISEWKDLNDTLKESADEFDSLGEEVGGAAGDILKYAGKISTSITSMANGIIQFVTTGAAALVAVAKTGEEAISTVEKASVILAVISAALQIAMAIASLFTDDSADKKIAKLQEQIDELQWELDNMDAVRLMDKLGPAVDNVRRLFKEATEEVVNMYLASDQTTSKWIKNWTAAKHEAEIYEKAVEKVVETYASAGYGATQTFGNQAYKEAEQQLKNYAEQMVLIEQQIEAEQTKKSKKQDKDQIKEWEQQLDELSAELSSLLDDLVEDIIGGSADDIVETLGDAFFDAFEEGEDAAQAWADAVDDMVRDIVKNMLVQELLTDQIQGIITKYEQKWFDPKTGAFAGYDVVIETAQEMGEEIKAEYEGFAENWEAIQDSLGDLFTSTIDQEASAGGFEAMGQETAEELNGRFTALQSSNEVIKEQSILIAESISQMIPYITADGATLSNLLQQQVVANDYLSDIAKYTQVLNTINATLSRVESNGLKVL